MICLILVIFVLSFNTNAERTHRKLMAGFNEKKKNIVGSLDSSQLFLMLILSFQKISRIFCRVCFCCSGVVLLLSLITNSSHLPFKAE